MHDNTPNTASATIQRLRFGAWVGAVLLMLLPLVAMQVTDEVNWSGLDFLMLGAMLLAVAVPLEVIARRTRNVTYLLAAGVALLSAFLLVLVNGAVGIIGSEDNPANLMYFAVLAVGVGGAIVTKGKAFGMARTMILAGAATVLVAVIAVARGMADSAMEVASVNAFFIIQFAVAALLFTRAADAGSGDHPDQRAGA